MDHPRSPSPPRDGHDAIDPVLDRLAARPDAPDRVREPEAFLQWAQGSDDALDGPLPLSRYLAELRSGRPDLLDAFPQIPGCHVANYREWARMHGQHEVPLADRFVPPVLPAPPPRYLQAGVNLAGFLTAELGVGEVARRIAIALRSASVPLATTTFARTSNRTALEFAADDDARFDTNIVCVNADSWGGFAQHVGPTFFEGRRTIAVWFWETSIFPSMFHSAFDGVAEIWAASAYVADILREAAPANLPVVEFPLPIIRPSVSSADMRDVLGLPRDRPFFVTSFDYNSVTERKNPGGAVCAFRAAFPDADGPVLVIKSINGERHRDDVARLHALAEGRDDIVLHDGYLDAADNTALLAQADCVVSLHRAEGFGLNIADAMALGTPVIATAYGGNLTFGLDDDTWLVPASEIRVGTGHFPYDADALWGDPDLDVAVTHLRDVAADPTASRLRADRTRERVLRAHTPETTGVFIRNRIAGSRADRERDAAVRTQAARAAETLRGRVGAAKRRIEHRFC